MTIVLRTKLIYKVTDSTKHFLIINNGIEAFVIQVSGSARYKITVSEKSQRFCFLRTNCFELAAFLAPYEWRFLLYIESVICVHKNVYKM